MHAHSSKRLRRPSYLPLLASLALGAAVPACAGTPRRLNTAESGRAAVVVNGDNFGDALRDLDEQQPNTPGYAQLRDAAARYQSARGLDALNDGDSEGALRILRQALAHYTPEDLGRGGLPSEIGGLARAVLEVVTQRGDEAHALAANRILAAVAPPDAAAHSRFDEIYQWGDRNRREFDAPWVHLGEMSDIFKEVARIVPAPDILQRASELLLARHHAAEDARAHPPANSRRFTFEDFQQLQAGLRNSSVDMAIIYLRIGDLHAAGDQVSQLSEGGDASLGTALRALANGEGGAEALTELASRLERVDPSAAEGICRYGRRTYPQDQRFAQCLAVSAARENNFALASAHLEAAARLAPQDSHTLRAALEASVAWLVRELGSEDPTAGRRAFVRSRALLDAWSQRMPRQPAPITLGELEEYAAQLELGQANLGGAREHLERATQAQPPDREAYLTLAEIAWRQNDGRRAITILEQGLALPLRPTESDSTFRPTFVLRMGLASQAANDAALARQHLTTAAEAFDALTRSLEGSQRANAYFMRAVALEHLGQTEQVRPVLNLAIESAPDSREIAAHVITFCLSHGRWQDARDLDRTARGQLNLDRTWQVYFGLWGVIAARLGHLEDDGGAATALEVISRGATAHSPWTVRLAQRYAGAIDRAALNAFAQSPGQHAEAHFYEAMLEVATGDAAGAERDLRGVVETNMLRFFEYEMAWDVLARGVQPLLSASRAAVSGPAAAVATPVSAGPAPRVGPGPVMVP